MPDVPKVSDKNFFVARNRSKERLFSRWAQGIQVDAQGLYSLTPEHMALQIAQGVQESVVIDAFCGCGGNTIAFARQKHITKVFAYDNDPQKIAFAKNNAQIYGVQHKIVFRCVDVLQASIPKGHLFADPPWEKGEGFLEEVCRWVQKHRGQVKLPRDHCVRTEGKISFFLTKENYPSFLLWDFR